MVPPVEMMSQPSFLSSWANSTIPALSETLIKCAFSHFLSFPFLKSSLSAIVENFLSDQWFPYFRANSQTFQDFWIELVLCFMDASFESIKGIPFKAWHTDLFDNLTGIQHQNPPSEWSHRSQQHLHSKHPQCHEHLEIQEISRVNIDDTAFISC